MPRNRSSSHGGRFAVTGPNMPKPASYADSGVAVSRAITESQRRHPPERKAPDEGTWYVRDLDGETVAYVENLGAGNSQVVTRKKK